MTPAALKSARHALGLSARGLGAVLHVAGRTIRRWERGDSPMPHTAALVVQQLLAARKTA